MIVPPPLPRKREVRPHRFVPCKRVVPHCIVGGGYEAAYAADRAHRHRAPGGADRDGLGGRCPAGVGHRQRGRAGHLGLGHHDAGRAGGGDHKGQGRHRQAIRGEHPRRRSRRGRPRRVDDPRGGAGGLVRVGTQTAADRPAQRSRRGGHTVDRRGQTCAQGGGLGRRRDDRAGRRGRRPHRAGRHHAAVAVGAGRRGGHRHPG